MGRFSLRLSPEFLSVDRAAPDLCCFLHKSFLCERTPEHLRNYFSSIPLFSGISVAGSLPESLVASGLCPGAVQPEIRHAFPEQVRVLEDLHQVLRFPCQS